MRIILGKLRWVPLLAILASSVARGNGDGDCLQTVFLALDGEPIPVLDRRLDRPLPELRDIVPGVEDPVALGFTPGGHAYLMVGDQRFDASPLNRGKVESEGLTNKGFVFVLDLPSARRKALSAQLRKGRHAGRLEYSCIHGACRVLRSGAGVQVGDASLESSWSAPALFKDLVENGLIDARTKTPVQVTVFRLSDTTFHGVRDAFRGQQDFYVEGYGGVAAKVSGVALVLAGGTYLVVRALSPAPIPAPVPSSPPPLTNTPDRPAPPR